MTVKNGRLTFASRQPSSLDELVIAIKELSIAIESNTQYQRAMIDSICDELRLIRNAIEFTQND
jgi:hypothetical protein